MTARESNGGHYAIVAGSGFQSFGEDAPARVVSTAYGMPSAPVRELDYGDHRVLYLARHGDDLLIPAHLVNYRANMKALRLCGARAVIAVNIVGIITRSRHPGQLVVPDQLIDYTWGRAHTLYDDRKRLEHVDFTSPFSAVLRESLVTAARRSDIQVQDGGVYAVTQGPRLETAAEVDRLERDGADLVGMTAMPEASLARELGMEYACLSLVVNYAAGRSAQPIHAGIETSMMTARMQAMKVLRGFFGAAENE